MVGELSPVAGTGKDREIGFPQSWGLRSSNVHEDLGLRQTPASQAESAKIWQARIVRRRREQNTVGLRLSGEVLKSSQEIAEGLAVCIPNMSEEPQSDR